MFLVVDTVVDTALFHKM